MEREASRRQIHDVTEVSHSVEWLRRDKDRFVISSFETNATPRCEAGTGEVTVWDASRWRRTRTFTVLDKWTITNGTHVDERPAANAGLGCSPHWFQAHPSFHNGGIIAAGYYERGIDILRYKGVF